MELKVHINPVCHLLVFGEVIIIRSKLKNTHSIFSRNLAMAMAVSFRASEQFRTQKKHQTSTCLREAAPNIPLNKINIPAHVLSRLACRKCLAGEVVS